LFFSLQRIETRTAAFAVPGSANALWTPDKILCGDSSVVRLLPDSESKVIAVKTSKGPDNAEPIDREATILKALNHPLVFGLRGDVSATPDHNSSIVNEFTGNGSLAAFLASNGQRRFYSATRIAKIIAGIAVAMRFVHSSGVIHRDLCPANILLDWDWTVRIADFGRSVSSMAAPLSCRDAHWYVSRYLAPECYVRTINSASDVFAFGLILFELFAGRPPFPDNMSLNQITVMIAVNNAGPKIPEFVLPFARTLIEKCWAVDPDDRPTFTEIVEWLAEIESKVSADVNSVKVIEFVMRIEEWECQNASD
jgi:serine/threonine protein kinase